MYVYTRMWSLLVILVLFASCEDEIPEFTLTTEEPTNITSPLVAEFSHQLADRLSDPHIATFIKEKCLERFDGDHNFLLTKERHTIVTNDPASLYQGLSFQEIITSDLPSKNLRQKSSTGLTLLRDLEKEHPLLQIFLFVPDGLSVADWNPKVYTPDVAYVNQQHLAKNKIAVISAHGKEILRSSKPDAAPDNFFIVVMENERTTFVKKSSKRTLRQKSGQECLREEAFHENDDGNIYHNQDIYDYENCIYNNDPPPLPKKPRIDPKALFPCQNSDRDNNIDPDHLRKFRLESFDRLQKIKENWFDTRFEFRVDIIFATSNRSVSATRETLFATGDELTDRFTFRRNSVNDIEVNRRVVTWQPDIHGTNMSYIWSEVDGGDPIEFNAGIETEIEDEDGNVTTINGSVKLTRNRRDDDLGSDLVEYCHDTRGEGEEYNTGSIIFFVNQQ